MKQLYKKCVIVLCCDSKWIQTEEIAIKKQTALVILMRVFRIANLGKKADKLHSKSNAAVRDKQVPLMQDHECNCSLVWHDTSSQRETKHVVQ